jgi:signal transduction histidine kinase
VRWLVPVYIVTDLQEAPAELASQPELARTDLIAMVSHDMRTPLASIKEALSLLSETATGQLDERQHRYLTVAREEIDRLNRMIDNLIEVSRMESGKVTMRSDPVDLPELLSTSIESLSLLISRRSLVVERTIPADLPPVMGDRDRLRRVFDNVIDNAIRHSPPGGTIRVDVGLVNPGSSVLAGSEILAGTGYIQATISDDGPGIPTEALERIFGRFERVDQHGPGIGLGLAIVRSIVEMHHGKVWAESNPGKGASFRLILPAQVGS